MFQLSRGGELFSQQILEARRFTKQNIPREFLPAILFTFLLFHIFVPFSVHFPGNRRKHQENKAFSHIKKNLPFCGAVRNHYIFHFVFTLFSLFSSGSEYFFTFLLFYIFLLFSFEKSAITSTVNSITNVCTGYFTPLGVLGGGCTPLVPP